MKKAENETNYIKEIFREIEAICPRCDKITAMVGEIEYCIECGLEFSDGMEQEEWIERSHEQLATIKRLKERVCQLTEDGNNSDVNDKLSGLSSKMICRNMEIEQLIEENRNYLELIKSLVSSSYEVEILQRESYEFIGDDKRIAQHFMLGLPVVQGFECGRMYKKIHDYDIKNPHDSFAAYDALRHIEEKLTEDKEK